MAVSTEVPRTAVKDWLLTKIYESQLSWSLGELIRDEPAAVFEVWKALGYMKGQGWIEHVDGRYRMTEFGNHQFACGHGARRDAATGFMLCPSETPAGEAPELEVVSGASKVVLAVSPGGGRLREQGRPVNTADKSVEYPAQQCCTQEHKGDTIAALDSMAGRVLAVHRGELFRKSMRDLLPEFSHLIRHEGESGHIPHDCLNELSAGCVCKLCGANYREMERSR